MNFAVYLESKVGALKEEIIIVTTLIAAIPFSILNDFIKGKKYQVLYSLIIGFIFYYLSLVKIIFI